MEATIKALKARANAHNLAVYVDKNTDSFYIADRATNSVIAPPPMCLEAVAGRESTVLSRTRMLFRMRAGSKK